MAINGDFIQGYGAGKAAAVSEKVAETVTEWLEENVDPDSGYVIDKSLTIEGAAADAKATGDGIDDLKSALLSCPARRKMPSGIWDFISMKTATCAK